MLACDHFKSTEAAILTKTTINLILNSAYRCAAKEALQLNFNANYIEMYSYKINSAWSLIKQINQSRGERGPVSSISPQTFNDYFHNSVTVMPFELKLLRLILFLILVEIYTS